MKKVRGYRKGHRKYGKKHRSLMLRKNPSDKMNIVGLLALIVVVGLGLGWAIKQKRA